MGKKAKIQWQCNVNTSERTVGLTCILRPANVKKSTQQS